MSGAVSQTAIAAKSALTSRFRRLLGAGVLGHLDQGRPQWVWLGLACSVLVHLILVLWASGTLVLPRMQAPDETILVQLVPPDEAPQPAGGKRETFDALNPAEGGTMNTARRESDRQNEDEAGAPGKAAPSKQNKLTKDERASLLAQAKFCWNIPAGWKKPGDVSVTVRFLLNPDGSLKTQPVVVEFPASMLGKAAADSAISAVLRCSPFGLPPEKYEEWKDTQLRFEP